MVKSILLELAENTKLAKKWDESVDIPFGSSIFYSRIKNPLELYRLIKNSNNNYLKQNLKEFSISEPFENDKQWYYRFSIGKIVHYIYVRPIENVWVMFSQSNNALNLFRSKILKYINGIDEAWLSYEQMGTIIEKYANYGGVRAIARAPHFKLPKRAPILATQREIMPNWYFEDIKFTVMFWAPREIFDEKEDIMSSQFKVSREYLDRIDSVEIGAEFINPGKSRLNLDTEANVKHIKEVPEATQKVFDTVFDFSSEWVKKFKECLPKYSFKYDSNGDILNLKKIKSEKTVEFNAFNDKDKHMTSADLIKLQQMLTIGDETELIGSINKSTNDSFFLNCIYKKFSDDAEVIGKLIDDKDNKYVLLNVRPGRVPGPFVLAQIYKVANQFAWHVSEPLIKNG